MTSYNPVERRLKAKADEVTENTVTWQWEIEQSAKMAAALAERLATLAKAPDGALNSPAFQQALQRANEQGRVLNNQIALTVVRINQLVRKAGRR